MLAIIPARGGSKRLTKKNFLKLGKWPLIDWTVRAAISSKCFSKIIISTDMEEIINYYKDRDNVQCIERSQQLSQDNTRSEEVILDILKKFSKNNQAFCLLQPTSPFRLPEDLVSCVQHYKAMMGPSVISGMREPHSQTFEQHSLDSFDKKALNGAIYITSTEHFLLNRTLYTDPFYLYNMPINRSLDIDTIHDFNNAKLMVKRFEKLIR